MYFEHDNMDQRTCRFSFSTVYTTLYRISGIAAKFSAVHCDVTFNMHQQLAARLEPELLRQQSEVQTHGDAAEHQGSVGCDAACPRADGHVLGLRRNF